MPRVRASREIDGFVNHHVLSLYPGWPTFANAIDRRWRATNQFDAAECSKPARRDTRAFRTPGDQRHPGFMNVALTPEIVRHSTRLIDSFARRLGRELLARSGDPTDEARRLFEAKFVVVSHTPVDDPILNYGNRAALDLWELPWETFTKTPSRLTAEPMHRDERARLLERTARDGFVDDYRGVRISSTGRRFLIERAIVWNVDDEQNNFLGQAATFDHWTWL